MGILALGADERVADVAFTADSLSVTMKDGRTIAVPLAWYPRLLQATSRQRKHWRISGGGYGIHWPELDEDLSTEGLLHGSPAPQPQKKHSPASEPGRASPSRRRMVRANAGSQARKRYKER